MSLKFFIVTLFSYSLVCISCQEREKKHWIIETELGKVRLELVADSVTIPFAMAILDHNTMIVSDRPKGDMILIDLSSGDKTKVRGVPKINNQGDGGLLDILPHPQFKTNQELFYVYSFQNEQGFSLAVERAKLVGDSLSGSKRLFTAQPYFPRASFYGSRLLYQDGYLYISTGVDKSKQDSAQVLTNHLGKIMRIKEDGSIPQDNPFIHVVGALPEIWCLGTRNAQGLTLNPYTNEIWEHEHGPQGGDEINILKPGKNYGWPVITYGREYDGTLIGAGLTQKEGMEQPYHYYVPSIAPSGMIFYTGDKFPKWKGNLFIGSMVLMHLNRLTIRDKQIVNEERILKGMNWRVRNVIQSPDGYLFIGVDGGMILKMIPE
ncbi:MAG: PQQ-dependent sugar dehydrogenase [Cyclobacteriaceae bacterium]|nr:PQQ-dependent sugar dehydrogenase [Cyclobacteriaceae bacterium]